MAAPPSVDKEHGFLKTIIANQMARKTYEEQAEDRKKLIEEKVEEFEQKVELEEDHERRLRRLKKASTQKPTRATYVPPSQRRGGGGSAPSNVFSLKVEYCINKVATLTVREEEDALKKCEQFADKYKMRGDLIPVLQFHVARRLGKIVPPDKLP